MLRKDTPVSYGILLANVVVFAITFFLDPKLSYISLVDFGAKVNWRLVDLVPQNFFMPMFLHGSLSHLLFNCVAIYYFAPMVERWFGSVKFLFLYLAMGLLATLGSFVASDKISLGASGAIYGLMAFHLYLYLLNKETYLRIFGNSVLGLIGFNLLYSFVVPNIDIAGHLFGFLGGMIVYFAVAEKIPRLPQRALALGMSLMLFTGCAWKYQSYRFSEDYYLYKISYYYQKQQIDESERLLQEYTEKYRP